MSSRETRNRAGQRIGAGADSRRCRRIACSRQVVIAGADHYFEYRQKELVAAIAAFFEPRVQRSC